MQSIKDPDYKLPIIDPLRKHRSFSNSANKPLLITGVEMQTGVKGDYVVKLTRAKRMSESAAVRELIAAFIAMELELPVALPALISISANSISLLEGEEYDIAKQSLGFNFGTRYVDNFQTLVVNQTLPEVLLDSAWEIFVFDVLIQNADRSHEAPKKPNILTNGKELLIFDHELAFGFVFDLSFNRNKEPWIIRDLDKLWIEKHCLFRSLKGTVFDEQNLLHKFVRLDNEFWSKSWEMIPDSWKNKEQFEIIQSFISQIVSNKSTFIRNLQLLLA